MIYLDYSANFPVIDEVLNDFLKTEKEYYGNTNSSHKLGQKSLNKYNELNSKIFKILKLNPNEYDIIFTSSASEANNLAIKGIYSSYSGIGKHILASPFEHSSVSATLGYLKETGADVEIINAENDGNISLDDLKAKLRNDTILLCMILIESETGKIQPYKEVVEILKNYPNCHLLIDATQAMSKIDIDYNLIDMFSFTPHKFGGIIGTGFLVKRKETILTPLIHGGLSTSIYRSSTFPLGLFSSSVKAIEIGYKNMIDNFKKVKDVYQYLITNLKKYDRVEINSFYDFPYILNISIKDKKASDVVEYLSDNDICVSQKSACSIKNTPSKTIFSIYHDKKRAISSFRISLSYLTKKEEIDEFIKVIGEYINE